MDFQIDRFVLASPCLLYLDTSVVFRLSLKHQGALPNHEEKRIGHVIELLGKLAAVKSAAVYSILAIEEIGAKARNQFLAGSSNLVRAQAAMLTAMKDAIDALGGVSATLGHPKASGTPEDAQRLRKGHRNLLRQHPSLDAMDALHIVFGMELHCSHFLSFDNGWKGIGAINLIHH